MSMRLILILSVLLLSVNAADAAAAAPPAPAAKSEAKDAKKEEKKEKKDSEKKDDKKMKIEGGLYTTDKVANVKSNKGNRPVSTDIIAFNDELCILLDNETRLAHAKIQHQQEVRR